MKFYSLLQGRLSACQTHQIYRVMKLTFILLTVTLIQVSAAVRAQKVTLKEKNASLTEVFKSIRQQTGFNFIYDMKLMETAKPVTISVTNTELKDALKQCFINQPFTYELDKKTIILKNKETEQVTPIKAVNDSTIRVEGRVVDDKGNGLSGATVIVKGTSYVIITGGRGAFSVQLKTTSAILVVSYLGYQTKEVTVSGADVNLTIRMEPGVSKLNAVTIVSNGYEDLPQERATGSFAAVSNPLFNRTTSTDVMDRLDGVVPGLQFNKLAYGTADIRGITIRGQSTLEANKQPLIIVDDVPYNGDINNINPNDIESVSVLKDAAAASIWGARAGNGVIVFKTKKGSYDKPLQVSFNTNLTVSEKPNLYALPLMTSSDYIDAEEFLFKQGNYDGNISNTYSYPLLSPVVDLLAQARAGTITQAAADAQINAMRNNDVRKDYLKYVYKNAVNQQYSLGLTGGSNTTAYAVSVGYDKDLGNIILTENDRLNLRSNFTFKPVSKLEINLSSAYTQQNINSGNPNTGLNYVPYSTIPYEMLAAPNGTPLVYGKDYLSSYAANPGDPRLLNWQFKPLEDIHDGYSKTTNYDLVFNAAATYHISKVFSASLQYNYEKTIGFGNNLTSADSYFVRNLVNLYTQPDGSPLIRPIPDAGILNQNYLNAHSSLVRAELKANKSWNDNSVLTVVAAAEVSENGASNQQSVVYGYNPGTLSNSSNMDFGTIYQYSNPYLGSGAVPNPIGFQSTVNRFTSVLMDAGYTFDQRYTISASARKDASNVFGVNANDKGVPLFSTGLSWDVGKEPFYKINFLPVLRLRATYGYNGNTFNGLSAISVINYTQGSTAPFTGLPYATISNPANKNLRWEKVGVMNLGVDFGFAGNRIAGSLEYYTKNSTDVIWISPIDPSTGFSSANSNSVNMNGKGIDIAINSVNLTGPIRWTSNVVFAYNTSKVTRFTPLAALQSADYLGAVSGNQPILGKTLYGIYAYKWAGLDHTAGNPQGYLNGEISEDYVGITTAPPSTLQFFGSSVPVTFGTFTNTFSYKQFSLSARIKYEFGFFFHASSTNYGNLFNSSSIGYALPTTADFAQRWQKPGDETHTNVPSMIYPDDAYRDLFYASSAALVAKGDNIRLQDLVASYTIGKPGKYFKNMKIYLTAQNLGIIWKANKFAIDPDYGYSIPQPKTISLGLNFNY